MNKHFCRLLIESFFAKKKLYDLQLIQGNKFTLVLLPIDNRFLNFLVFLTPYFIFFIFEIKHLRDTTFKTTFHFLFKYKIAFFNKEIFSKAVIRKLGYKNLSF